MVTAVAAPVLTVGGFDAATFTVKYTPAEGGLVPAELEADTFQM